MQPCRWRGLKVTFSWPTNRIAHCQLIALIAISSRLSGWHESPERASGSLAFGNLSGNVTRVAVELGSIHEQTCGIGRPADRLVDWLVVACAAAQTFNRCDPARPVLLRALAQRVPRQDRPELLSTLQRPSLGSPDHLASASNAVRGVRTWQWLYKPRSLRRGSFFGCFGSTGRTALCSRAGQGSVG